MSGHAIDIGEGKSIKWIEFDAVAAQPAEIDDLLQPTLEFWKKLETECMAECCGIDAFSFLPEEVKTATQGINTESLSSDLKKLKEQVLAIDNNIISSSEINQLLDKRMFIELLEYLEKKV